MAAKQLPSLMVAGTFEVAQEMCMSIWNILAPRLVTPVLKVHQRDILITPSFKVSSAEL